MFPWIESEILAMPGSDYLVFYAFLIVALLFLTYFAYGSFKRFRFMDATATSKIRSAAQGHVELKGLGEWMLNDTIMSPFSMSRCVWYRCTIDKKRRVGKRTTWSNVSDECSDHLFRLVDDTGECIIDPDDAHVVPETDVTWYGRSMDHRNQVPSKSSLIQFGFGRYRFRERLIRPATQLYALGWFHTVRSDPPAEETITSRVEELIKHWKLQPRRYLAEFDFDQNGKIQKGEWKAIRAAARKQVLAAINDEKSEHHLMSRPKNTRQPYILSALQEEDLVRRKKWVAYSSIIGAFVIFSVLVMMFSVRAPLPL